MFGIFFIGRIANEPWHFARGPGSLRLPQAFLHIFLQQHSTITNFCWVSLGPPALTQAVQQLFDCDLVSFLVQLWLPTFSNSFFIWVYFSSESWVGRLQYIFQNLRRMNNIDAVRYSPGDCLDFSGIMWNNLNIIEYVSWYEFKFESKIESYYPWQ